MGGFLGIGGSQQKTNRKIQLQGNTDLNNIFNWALPNAENSFSAGQSALAGPTSYWSQILSGNRAAVNQAVAPETNMVRSASDAATRQQAAMGTARGGGTAAANQQRDSATQAQIDNAIFGARGNAATNLSNVGSTELNTASNLLGMGTNIAQSLFAGPGSSTNTGGNTASDIGSTIAQGILSIPSFANLFKV